MAEPLKKQPQPAPLARDAECPIYHPTISQRQLQYAPEVRYCLQWVEHNNQNPDTGGDLRGWFSQDRPFGSQLVQGHESVKKAEPLFVVSAKIQAVSTKTGSWDFASPYSGAETLSDGATKQKSDTQKDSGNADEPLTSADDKDDDKDPVLTLGDLSIHKTYPKGDSIAILSPLLRHGLRKIIQFYPLQSLMGDTITVTDQLAPLMHHMASIKQLSQHSPERSEDVLPGVAEARETVDDKHELARQFRLLAHHLEPIFNSRWLELEKKLQTSEAPLVDYDSLWFVFRPGQTIYYRPTEKMPEVYAMAVVCGCHVNPEKDRLLYDDSRRSERSVFDDDYPSSSKRRRYEEHTRLDLWEMKSDGTHVGRSMTFAKIKPFKGEKLLTSLEAYPTSYWDLKDGGKRRSALLSRGKSFVQLLTAENRLTRYSGPFSDLDERFRDMGEPRPVSIPIRVTEPTISADTFESLKLEGTVILNFAAAVLYAGRKTSALQYATRDDNLFYPRNIEHNGHNQRVEDVEDLDRIVSRPTYWSRFEKLHIKRDMSKPQDDLLYLLVHPIVIAFDTDAKLWGLIDVNSMWEHVPKTDPTSSIILNSSDLVMIKALANTQKDGAKSWSADFVEGKGRGKIVLLHGAPGAGKTYTVECIAEWLRRPLLPLTATDLGSNESYIEEKLTKWFGLAEKCNAVMLIDEADVFLEKRQYAQVERNGIVSAFLRKMEYFSGLLFLTTNRPGLIDEAIVSRIHLIVEYPSLNEHTERRNKIIENFLEKVDAEQKGKVKMHHSAKKFLLESPRISECKWNGREIRNAIQTAIALAQYEAETEDKDYDPSKEVFVLKSHFKSIIKTSLRFRTYLDNVWQKDQAERARQGRERFEGHAGLRNDILQARPAEDGQANSGLPKVSLGALEQETPILKDQTTAKEESDDSSD